MAFDSQDGTDYNLKTGPTRSGETRVLSKNNEKKIMLCFLFEKKKLIISLLLEFQKEEKRAKNS